MGSHVNEASVEWPPSPWRLLRALDSAGFTDVRLCDRRDALDQALRALARARPPQFELPAATAAHTRHFVPLTTYSPTRAGDTSLLIDAFHALDPDDELVAWWDVELGSSERDALAAAAASVGYLGRSESVCTMRLVAEPRSAEPDALDVDAVGDEGAWRDAGRVSLLAVAANADDPLDILRITVTEMRRRRMLVPPGTRPVTYLVRAPSPASEEDASPDLPGPTIAHLRLAGPTRPALFDAVVVGNLLRAALQREFEPGSSRVFSGHDGDGHRRDQHAHAHFLALPGRRDKRVESLVVWAREGFGRDELVALSRLSKLSLRDIPNPLPLALTALGDRDDLSIPRLLGPARTWRSLTPFALTRHPKRRGGRVVDGPEDQVRRELNLRDLPLPRDIALIKGDWMRFTRARPGVSRREAPTVVGVRMTFDHEVCGPFALGALSHFGLGLFEPGV